MDKHCTWLVWLILKMHSVEYFLVLTENAGIQSTFSPQNSNIIPVRVLNAKSLYLNSPKRIKSLFLC